MDQARVRNFLTQILPVRVMGCVTVLAMVTLASELTAQESLSTWKNTAGKTIDAEFIELRDEIVVIRMGDKRFCVALEDLAAESQKQALEMNRLAKAAAATANTDLPQPVRPAQPTKPPASSGSQLSVPLDPPLRSPKQMSVAQLWDALVVSQDAAAAATLELAKRPQQTTQYLATKMVPLNITREQVVTLVKELSSSDDATWKSAQQKLAYFDPRLVMGLEEIFALEAVQEFPARQRLTTAILGPLDFLLGCEPNAELNAEYSAITLEKFSGDQDSNAPTPTGDQYLLSLFIDGENAGGVLVNGSGAELINGEWMRLLQGLAILESVGTPEADAIIKAFAFGHPEAEPTKFARQILAERR